MNLKATALSVLLITRAVTPGAPHGVVGAQTVAPAAGAIVGVRMLRP